MSSNSPAADSPDALDSAYERIRFRIKPIYSAQHAPRALKQAIIDAITALNALEVEVEREKARHTIRSAEQALAEARELLALLDAVNTPT
jgi:hypothetical protein